jgi:hypothetical protein
MVIVSFDLVIPAYPKKPASTQTGKHEVPEFDNAACRLTESITGNNTLESF